MLPSNRRLTTKFFDETITGRSFHSPLVSIKVILSSKIPGTLPKIKYTRFAVSTSKKYFKTAVSRNYARRKVYSAIHPLLSYVNDGFCVIILIKPDAVKLKQPELRSVLGNIFDKAGIMKKNVSKVE